MSILVDEKTRVAVVGITGKAATFHARHCISYGTNIVAGVRPGKGGQTFDGAIPIYDSTAEAVAIQRANAVLIFVPPPGAADAIGEAIDAEVPLIVCITEGIPSNDMFLVKERLLHSRSTLIGPNSPGIISPGKTKLGIMPSYIHRPGRVGIVSRSGTLTFETVLQLTKGAIGQSTCVGIGGDSVHGLSHRDVVRLFNGDPDTDGIIMVGEIGGEDEEDAAEYVKRYVKKPVAAFIAGTTAPPGRRMGHAGAIVSGKKSGASYKIAALERAGIAVAKNPAHIAETYAAVAGLGPLR
ncbi:MAG: succinate--CoA ligase subunit alpha [Puniceicoccales bacterium]|jgi:succinyl-CoA synthetase alpha subunit|nr:succinate--CoA ligase subunit alpha [Puniceicoccales bacterium]